MGIAEYILGLLAILSGLAISDMVSSLHGVFRRARHVRFGVLPVCSAVIVLEVICYSWFISWRSEWENTSFWLLLIAVAQLIGVFLAAKAVLPDDDGTDAPIDLVAHYWHSNQYVWLSLTFSNIITFIIFLVPLFTEPGRQFPFYRAAYIVLGLALASIQNRWVHLILVPLILIAITALWGNQVISGSV